MPHTIASPDRLLWSQVPLRARLAWLKELRHTHPYYQFSFRYFDAWTLLRLQCHIHWQLPAMPYQIALYRASIDEYESLKDILLNRQLVPYPPKLVMDFGCGLGRSSIFLRYMLRWHGTKFLLVDGQQAVHGNKANMTPMQGGVVTEQAQLGQGFYTDFDLLERFLVSNAMYAYDLINLHQEQAKLQAVRDVEVFYSFHSVGYHFDPAMVFSTYGLPTLMKPGALVILGLRQENVFDLDPLYAQGLELVRMIAGTQKQRFAVLRKWHSQREAPATNGSQQEQEPYINRRS